MKLTKQKLKKVIKEELSNIIEGGYAGHYEREPEYEKNWVVRRSGVHDSEAYMGNNWKWGPPEDAWRVEFEAEAKGTINYGVESGKIESGQPVELSPVEPLRLGRPEHDPLDTSPRGIRNRRRLQGRGIKNYPLDK